MIRTFSITPNSLPFSQCATQTSINADSLNNLMNKATGTLEKIANAGQEASQQVNATATTASVSAKELAEMLAKVRTSAESKIDEVSELLNRTSTSEQAVVERAFQVVETIIEQVNRYTNLNLTNEYEAADVSRYIQERIADANSLLNAVRKYINEYVDKANETIRTVEPQITDSASQLTNYITQTTQTVTSIINAINSMKEKLKVNKESVPSSVPTIGADTSDDVKRTKYDDILAAIESVNKISNSISNLASSVSTQITNNGGNDVLANILNQTAKTANSVNNIGSSIKNVVNTLKGISL